MSETTNNHSPEETPLFSKVGTNIQWIVDTTKSGIGAVCTELVQTTGEVLHFGVDAAAHVSGKVIRSIGTGTVELAKAVVGKEFRSKKSVGKTQQA